MALIRGGSDPAIPPNEFHAVGSTPTQTGELREKLDQNHEIMAEISLKR